MYFRLGTYNKYGYGAEHVLRLRVWKIIIVSIKKTEFRTSDFKYFKIGTNSTTKYSNICVEYLHDFISIHWNLNISQNKNITENKWKKKPTVMSVPDGSENDFYTDVCTSPIFGELFPPCLPPEGNYIYIMLHNLCRSLHTKTFR